MPVNNPVRRPGVEKPGPERADYRFSFEPLGRRVRAEFNGVTVADSERVMVMRETRLPPAFYFPLQDVRMDLMQRSQRHTHCPFKGNASYWTLIVDDRSATDVMWVYEDPFADASEIAGYGAFYHDLLDALYQDDERLESVAAPAGHYSNPLMDWIIREAPSITESKALTLSLIHI